MGYINEVTGNVGEYNIDSTNTTDNVVDKIKEYELSFEDNGYLQENADNFGIKNLGIRNDSGNNVVVNINNRPFTILASSALNLPHIEMIKSIVFETSGAKVCVRYVY